MFKKSEFIWYDSLSLIENLHCKHAFYCMWILTFKFSLGKNSEKDGFKPLFLFLLS